MAFRRRFGRRRYGRRRRYAPGAGLARRRRRPTNWIGLARKAYSTATWLAGMVNTERKFFDTALTLSPSQTGVFVTLLDIPQGDSAVTRDGRSLRLKDRDIRFTIQQAVGAETTLCRVCVIADLRPNAGEVSAAGDFFEAGAASNIFALPTMAAGGRFRTLKNWVIKLMSHDTTATSETALDIAYRHAHFKLDKVVKYDDSDTDDPQNYNLYVVAFCNTLTETPSMNGEARVRYIDN